MDNYTTKSDGIPSTFLIHARAISAWGNSVGMTPIQKAIHLYVASMLSTNEECWTSISGMAKQIGATRRGCQYAVSSGKQFFDHEGHDEKASDPAHAKRLWKLVMPMPTTVELAKFLPGRKAKGLRKDCTDPCKKISQTGLRKDCTQVNHSPSVRDLEPEEVKKTGGGGGENHHQGGQKYVVKGDDPRSMSSKGYPRYASLVIFASFQHIAKGEVNEAIKASGIIRGSTEWGELFPRDGSAVYKPSDADLDYLIPLAEASVANGVEFTRRVSTLMLGWIRQQIRLAIDSHTPFRDCLRMSAFSNYLSGFDSFDKAQEENNEETA